MSVFALTDVLVIGGSPAARRCAAEVAAAGLDVVHVNSEPAHRSPGGPETSSRLRRKTRQQPNRTFAAIVRSSDWGADQSVVRRLVDALPALAADPTNHFFDANEFGEAEIESWTGTDVLELIADGDRCWGAVVLLRETGELRAVLAKATVLANGGAVNLYGNGTRRTRPGEGSAAALALGLGAPVGNPEAIQFHPMTAVPSGIAIRDEWTLRGAELLDGDLQPVLDKALPGPTGGANRDLLARCMDQRLRAGTGVRSSFGYHLWLDARQLVRQLSPSAFATLQRVCEALMGIDPARDLVPIRPTPHYAMGGVRTNRDGHAYRVQGLFAVGEAACWDLHGFNRHGGLGAGLAVAEACLIGRQVAAFARDESLCVEFQLAARARDAVKERLEALRERRGPGPTPPEVHEGLTRVMRQQVGIMRDEPGLKRAAEVVRTHIALAERAVLPFDARTSSSALAFAFRLPGLTRLAYVTVLSALARTESRGAHYRAEYPARDDADWLVRTLAAWPDGAPEPILGYEPVGPLELAPRPRGAAAPPPVGMKRSVGHYNAHVETARLRAGAQPTKAALHDERARVA